MAVPCMRAPLPKVVNMFNDTSDYRSLFLNDTPLLDVRAPIEFSKGAFPGAVNLPLMNDVERQKVGTCYKQEGSAAAIAVGHRLVSGQTKEERIAAWLDFAKAHPDGYLYCFRGGLRSQTVQTWMHEAGIPYPRVIGGYKALRTYLLETTEHILEASDLLVLGGMTGTGKTDVLLQLENGLDLEGHAHHRGSSFGRHADEQPVQIDFENRLAIDMLKKQHKGIKRYVVEDEGLFIGRCSVPQSLNLRMRQAPIVWLEDSLENRVERILRDYVVGLCGEFVALHGRDAGQVLYAQRLRQSLDNIVKRLGHQRHAQLADMMDAALAEQLRSGEVGIHREWIAALLEHYYDPMYQHQRQQKSARAVFSGDQAAVLDYLRNQAASEND